MNILRILSKLSDAYLGVTIPRQMSVLATWPSCYTEQIDFLKPLLLWNR